MIGNVLNNIIQILQWIVNLVYKYVTFRSKESPSVHDVLVSYLNDQISLDAILETISKLRNETVLLIRTLVEILVGISGTYRFTLTCGIDLIYKVQNPTTTTESYDALHEKLMECQELKEKLERGLKVFGYLVKISTDEDTSAQELDAGEFTRFLLHANHILRLEFALNDVVEARLLDVMDRYFKAAAGDTL